MATIIVSAIISAITSKIVATYYFEKTDRTRIAYEVWIYKMDLGLWEHQGS